MAGAGFLFCNFVPLMCYLCIGVAISCLVCDQNKTSPIVFQSSAMKLKELKLGCRNFSFD